MPINDFIEELKKIGIILNDNQLNQLERYYELLVEKNKVMNLTGIVEKEEVYLKHFYDSLTIVKSIDLNKISNLCDIGTGAGFPGLVLKIVFPQLKVVLLDSLNKRVDFLNNVINTLNLKNIEVIHTRAEEYALSHRNSFDVTTARAVANLSILLEYAIPMTKVGGYFIALKGNVREELEDSKNALKELNTTFIDLCEFSLPVENSIRSICKFQKNGDVKKYPRKYSEIKKRKL
jgi:16S rRNA methyltransferase gidB